MLKVGATRMSPPRRCASCAMISGQSQSVPRSPVGPCCSFEPMGMTTVVQRRSHSSISGQVDRARIMAFSRGVGSGIQCPDISYLSGDAENHWEPYSSHELYE